MTRYILEKWCAGNNMGDPSSGTGDFVGPFETEEEAEAWARAYDFQGAHCGWSVRELRAPEGGGE